MRLGFGSEASPRFRREAVERTVSKVFRPELINRIDRIVVFRPFERDQIRALLQRELAQVLERRGFRGRPWAVEWDEAALEFLAEKGFSVELGARPLKRAVERYLLAPLASAIVSRSFPEGDQFLFVTSRDDQIEVTFVDPDADEGEPDEIPSPGLLRLERLVLEPSGAAGETAFLQSETERLRAVIEGESWLGRKEHTSKRCSTKPSGTLRTASPSLPASSTSIESRRRSAPRRSSSSDSCGRAETATARRGTWSSSSRSVSTSSIAPAPAARRLTRATPSSRSVRPRSTRARPISRCSSGRCTRRGRACVA